MDHFLHGLVLILILGMGLASSFRVRDEPYMSTEDEEGTLEELTAEMNRLDKLNDKEVTVKDVQYDASDKIEEEYKKLIHNCTLEGQNQISDQELKDKHDKFQKALRKLYQSLQHGKGSVMDDLSWLEAKRSEICSACILRKLCERNDILNLLGINVNDADKVIQCKRKILEKAKGFHEQPVVVNCNGNARFRTIDGRCNNLDNPLFGSVGTEFRRIESADYADCISTLRRAKNGDELPNERKVSIEVHGSNADRTNPNSKVLSHLAMNFGQFMDHDFTLAEAQGLNCEHPNPECINIEVPASDAVFQSRGVQFFEMERDAPHKPSVDCKLVSREHSNTITAFIDASNVYGSTDEHAEELRTADGLLKVMKHPYGCPLANLLPAQPPDVFCVSKDPLRPCFEAGDERANENQGLMSVHTIFVREHNRIATWFGQNFQWSGERIYQETRKIIGAALQLITYNEFLPLILSKKTRKDFDLILLKGTDFYTGYDKAVNPQMSAAFSVAAYRFGHSLVQETFNRFTQDGYEHKACNCNERSEYMPIPLLDFGNPTYLYDKCQGGVDSIFRGLMKDQAGKIDGRFSESVQHNLARGEGDLSDLVSLNIRRGRERGVPGYTRYRNGFGIVPAVNNFADLVAAGFSQEDADNLKATYDNVEDIDLFTGGMLEPPSQSGGLLGETFQKILGEQFQRLRKGDRFWHENDGVFTACQLREIRKILLSKVICDNGDEISAIQRFALQQSKIIVDCDALPRLNLKVWAPNFQCDVSSDQSADSADYHDEL